MPGRLVLVCQHRQRLVDALALAHRHVVKPVLQRDMPLVLSTGDVALPTIADLGESGLGKIVGVEEGVDELTAVGFGPCGSGQGIHAVGLVEGHIRVLLPACGLQQEPIVRYGAKPTKPQGQCH